MTTARPRRTRKKPRRPPRRLRWADDILPNDVTRLERALAIMREDGRKEMERLLSELAGAEELVGHFKALYDDAPLPYLTLAASGIVIDVNKAAAKLMGHPLVAIRGRPFQRFIDRLYSDDMLRHLVHCRDSDDAIVTEITLRTATNQSISVELISRSASSANSRFALTMIRDLTERQLGELALVASEKRYREIVETTNEGICIVDTSNRITLVNRAFARLVGWTSDELIGRSADELLPPEEAEAARTAFARRDLGAAGVREQRLRRADRTTVWTNVSASLMRDDEGRFAGMLRLYSDISDRKALENARDQLVRDLVRTQEAERKRLSRELHDQMGQHLVGLSLGLSRLAQLGATSAEMSQLTERLQRIAEIMTRDVQHLAFELRPASLDDLGLAEAVSNYADGIAQRFGLEVDVQCDRLTRLDTTAETTVYRIVQEALTNIVKHATARHVSVILEPRGSTLQAIIEDDGVGFQPQKVLRNGAPGRLGLRGMIERAALVRGDLQIESKPGRGTTIFLRVPLGAKESERVEETAPVARGRSRGRA